ncbi:hypothetical protein [Vibrio phage vB_VnaS-AQKL99]|nr:hypothetical protein [Vibrio phage vB_VnaS-AQKL99]
MKTYTNTSNCARAAKAQLSKILGLDKKDVIKGTHFEVREAEFADGFIWHAIGNQTPVVEKKLEIKRVKVARRTVKVEAPAKAEGIKIQKDREERNGVKRPSAGGKCAQLWHLFDAMYGEKGIVPTPKPAKARSAELGLDPVTTQVQLYRWREFMGFKGK